MRSPTSTSSSGAWIGALADGERNVLLFVERGRDDSVIAAGGPDWSSRPSDAGDRSATP
jgi:hypothetical protein